MVQSKRGESRLTEEKVGIRMVQNTATSQSKRSSFVRADIPMFKTLTFTSKFWSADQITDKDRDGT